MNRTEARELREQRGKIANDMALIANSAKQEDRDRWTLLDKEQEALRVRIEAVEKTANLNEELHGSARPPSGQPGAGNGENRTDPEKEYREAWASCMRYGFQAKPHMNIRGISPAQQNLLTTRSSKIFAGMDDQQREAALSMLTPELRDMLTQGGGAYPGGVGSQGGFFVPTGFVYDVEQALKFYGGMLGGGVGDPKLWETATGQPMPYPTSNDTIVTGERLSENQQATQNDVNLGMITFNAWIYSTKLVKVSLALLQDSAFDIQAFLTEQFATRIGRILNTDFTTGAGSGSSAPNGIITASVSGGTAVGSATNDGGSNEANNPGSDDLITLEHSVDPLYRNGAKYMMHDSTLAALKKVKDKYGRPLWMPNIIVGQPDRLNGYPFLINNDMDTLQTQVASPTVTKKVILFGKLDKYLIRRVRELSVMRLEERFAEFGQVAFLGFARYDGNLLDAGTHPTKYLQTTY